MVNEHRLMNGVLLKVIKPKRCLFNHLNRVQKRTSFGTEKARYNSKSNKCFTVAKFQIFF